MMGEVSWDPKEDDRGTPSIQSYLWQTVPLGFVIYPVPFFSTRGRDLAWMGGVAITGMVIVRREKVVLLVQ
jgi:hypothetical protein